MNMWCQHFICEMKMMIISLGELMTAVKSARKEKRATSIGFHGNIVDVSLCYHDDEYVGGDAGENYHILKVWEEFVREYKRTGQLLVELGSGSSNHHQHHHWGYLK